MPPRDLHIACSLQSECLSSLQPSLGADVNSLWTLQASQQQLGHAPVSQANSQQATANQFAPAVDGISSNNQVPKASETREEQQEVRRKRFKEFKDTPLPVNALCKHYSVLT